MHTAKGLREAFFGHDPFSDYEPDFPFNTNWCGENGHRNQRIFGEVFAKTGPRLLIEVGSWKGASALAWADLMGGNGLIICIDTWLGSREMLGYPELHRHHGYPQVYYQFLSNILLKNRQDMIVPMPLTSHIGALLLADYRIEADLIYIDASHDYHDVKRDLIDYWPLVKQGGYLFGDDYQWDGVALAAQEFSSQVGAKLEIFQEHSHFYLMRKA